MAGAACATTRLKDCAYHANAPATDEGRMVWGTFQENAWRLRVVGMGYVAGVESDQALRRLVALGLDQGNAEDLWAACERGLVGALNEKEDDDGQ